MILLCTKGSGVCMTVAPGQPGFPRSRMAEKHRRSSLWLWNTAAAGHRGIRTEKRLATAPGDSVWSYRRHSAILFVLQLQPSHTISFRRKRSCSSNRIRERCPLLSQSAGFYRVLRQQRCGSSSSVKPIIVLCYARCKHLFSFIFSIVLQSPASNRKIRQQLSLL